MASPDQPVRHHHVPVFYLRRWCDPDGRLRVMRRVGNGELREMRQRPEEVGFEKHLWSLSSPLDGDRQPIERDFFAPLDNKAAIIANKMIAGHRRLNEAETLAWAEFLASLHIRVPERVHRVRREVPEQLRAYLDGPDPDFDRLRGDHPAQNLREFSEMELPHVMVDAGVRLLPQIIEGGKAVSDIAALSWGLRSFQDTTHTLLTSDAPLLLLAPLRADNCLIVLPLSPRHVFFAARRPDIVGRLKRAVPSDLVRRTNETIVTSARSFIVGDCDIRFVRRRWTDDG